MSSFKPFTKKFKANLNKTASSESPIKCVVISSPFLSDDICLVSDNCDFVGHIDGVDKTFIACPFDISVPSDFDKQESSTELKISNVNRSLTSWITKTQGAPGASVRFLLYLRSEPLKIEFDCLFDGKQIITTQESVSITLGFERTLNKSAIGVRYSKYYAPGLY